MSNFLLPAVTLASAMTLAAGSALATGEAYGVGRPLADAGATTVAASGARVIDLATARTINVTCGETVTFVNGGKTFTWKFDDASHRPVELAKVAPPDFGATAHKAYVARSDAEMGG